MNMLRYGGTWHSSIPNEFIQYQPQISDGAFRVYILLLSYASPSSPNPFPSWHTLCRRTNHCRNALAKYLKELEDKGWLLREQQTANGVFGSNVYTLYPDDQASKDKRKQFCLPSTIPWDTATRDTATRDTAEWDTKSTTTKDHHTIRKTTTNSAAGAARGVGASASQLGAAPPSPLSAFAIESPDQKVERFVTTWKKKYSDWFGIPYKATSRDKDELLVIFEEIPNCYRKDLAYVAYKVWLSTQGKTQIESPGRDPLFYSFKGSRSLAFFCRYIDKIIGEQKDVPDNVFGKIDLEELKTLDERLALAKDE